MIIAAVALSGLVVFAATQQQVIMKPPLEMLQLHSETTKSDGFYNLSLAVVNISGHSDEPTTVHIVKVHVSTIDDAAIYYNCTLQSGANAMQYDLKPGDTLQVNFIISTATHGPGTGYVTVFAHDAMYAQVATLPP